MENDFYEILMNKLLKEIKAREISTGFVNLDYLINGMKGSSLMLLSARPAMGKTSFALNLATKVAVQEKIPVAIFNLELSKEQCCNRILATEALVNFQRLNNEILTDIDWINIAKATRKFGDSKIYIYDKPGISIQKIEEQCRNLKKDKNIGFVVIDYLQLISFNEEGRKRIEIEADIAKRLKKLANELDINILLLSQLSRLPEKRFKKGESPVPTLTDIKNLDLVQYADIIMFLYREGYYFMVSEENCTADVIVAKNNFGDCGSIKLVWKKEFLKFEEGANVNSI